MNLKISDIMKNDGLYPTTRDKNTHSPEEVREFKESLLTWMQDALNDGWKRETTFWNGEDSIRLTMGMWKAHIITRSAYLGIHVFCGHQAISVPHVYNWRFLHTQTKKCSLCGR